MDYEYPRVYKFAAERVLKGQSFISMNELGLITAAATAAG